MSTQEVYTPIIAPITKELIKTFLPDNPVILEAGAHKGRDTIKMLKLWSTGTFYCFEPSPEIFTQLTQTLGERTNVHCYPYALARNNGTATFHVSSGRSDAASSLLAPLDYSVDHPDTIFNDITVQTKTLDSWAQEHGIEKIDFMWLDMQGTELEMLQSGTKILQTVTAICSEVNLTHRYKDAPLYDEYRAWMESQGFYVAYEHLFKTTWGNALFIRKENLS